MARRSIGWKRGCYTGAESCSRAPVPKECSGVAAILAKQIELQLHRAIREAEQHRILIGFVGHPLPTRHHEQVARAPVKRLFADPRPTLAFDRREYGGIRGTIARGLEALRQQLDERADGRH